MSRSQTTPCRLAGATAQMADGLAARQVSRLAENARRHGIRYIPMRDSRHGIVHVIGPELGLTLPGATLVCGDSHTCTHGALGALAFGIGASECECILATQTLRQRKQKRLRVTLSGRPAAGVGVKDIVLGLIARIGVGGGVGHAIEYAGDAVASLSMEARMTLCNMSIEAGSRVGMIAPDETTFAYLEGRPFVPRSDDWTAALNHWKTLASDPDARFDREVALDVGGLDPRVTWGTTPEENLPVGGEIPDPDDEPDLDPRARMRRSLAYMDLAPRTRLTDVRIDRVFIGSCTNGRLDDLRQAAAIVAGRQAAKNVAAIVVPGSATVRRQAEIEGLDRIFRDAGFEWRDAGCSMCAGMNDDRLARASVAPRPRTAISRDVRGGADARI